jgi:hypothetical protein
MTDDTKHKIGDKSAQPGDGAHKLDNPETKDLVNAGGTAMRGIESTRTNKSSGSFDESQEMSIEIDFGNGHRESRRNKGAGETGQPAETTKPSREQLRHETLGALIPLAQVADVEAFPVLQSQADHADVSRFPQPQPLPFRPELKPLPIPILPKDGPSPILHPPHPETAAKTSLEPPLPRPNGPVYVDRTVPSPLLHQSHAHEAASVESAALQAVVPRGADSGVIEGARDLTLSPKDQPIAGYSPETHDKNGFVKDPVGYGLMLAQQVKPGDVRTDVAPPPTPVPHINKPTQSQAPAPVSVPAPFSPSVKPVFSPAPVVPVTHKDTSVSPQFHPTLAPQPIDYAELARKTREQSETSLKEELSARETLNQSKHTLEVNARAVITNKTECDQFLADMSDFEKGYVERTPLDRAKALLEVAETYKQVDRLLTASSDAIPHTKESAQKPGDTPWRVQIAEQIMHHAAVPTSVDQGPMAVCVTESLQVRLYYRDPSSIAKLIADVAIGGKYLARTGDKSYVVPPGSENLVPDAYARAYDLQSLLAGKPVHALGRSYFDPRSFASQVFDVTAVNMAISGKQAGNSSHLQYFQPTQREIESVKVEKQFEEQGSVKGSDGRNWSWADFLESKSAPNSEDVVKLNRWITGKVEQGFVIESGGLSPAEAVIPANRQFSDFGNLSGLITRIYRSEELSGTLLKLKESQQWPPIVRMDLSKPPTREKGGAHLMVITDISADGKLLSYDNTWGKQKDRTGIPKISTAEMGASILSKDINDFTYLSDSKKKGADVSSNKQVRLRLSEYSRLLSGDGIDLSQQKHKDMYESKEAKDWLTMHPWDRRLVEWKKAIDALLAKYP